MDRDTTTLAAARIAARAETILQEGLDSASHQITCECHDGVLVLRGRLPSFYEKQVAQEALRTLEGVDQIVNQIEVVPTN
jgi:osmotically-inducible protein OsmY